MANRNAAVSPQFPSREDKMYSGGRTDPYQQKKKLPEPTQCPSCGAVFAKGRWTWKTADAAAN